MMCKPWTGTGTVWRTSPSPAEQAFGRQPSWAVCLMRPLGRWAGYRISLLTWRTCRQVWSLMRVRLIWFWAGVGHPRPAAPPLVHGPTEGVLYAALASLPCSGPLPSGTEQRTKRRTTSSIIANPSFKCRQGAGQAIRRTGLLQEYQGIYFSDRR